MLPQLRDTLVHDSTAYTGSSHQIDCPTVDNGGLIDVNDWGVALLVWSANSGTALTGLVSNWTVLIPPTLANQIGFAVVVHQVTAADVAGTPGVPDSAPGAADGILAVPPGIARLTVTLDKGMYFLSVTSWYRGVSRVDAVGPLGVNPNAVMTTSVAPSMVASGISDELILAMFATIIRTGHGGMVLDRGVVRVDGIGSANTVRGVIADFSMPALGSTGDVTATYDFGLSSRAGVQIGLFPLTPSIGGVAKFKSSVTLGVVGVAIGLGTAEFGLSVTMGSTGLLGSRAQFTPTVGLSVRARNIVRVGFRTAVTLTVRGAKVGVAAFPLAVRLTARGEPVGEAAIAFAPSVALSVSGMKRALSAVALGPDVTLSVIGIPVKRGRPNFSTSVRLSAAGTPSVLDASVGLGPTVRLFTQHPVVRVSGLPQFGFVLRLRAQAALTVISAAVNFAPEIEFTAIGTPNFNPVGQVAFNPTVVFEVDGFKRPAQPVGITVKPVKVEQDPDWHGQPKHEHEWQDDLPVGDIGLGVTVTLEADGADPAEAVVATSSSVFWSTE
jgi:hypothetical protein